MKKTLVLLVGMPSGESRYWLYRDFPPYKSDDDQRPLIANKI